MASRLLLGSAMIPPKRRGKLNLKTETVRNLTNDEMGNVAGGMLTISDRCSTAVDTGCCISNLCGASLTGQCTEATTTGAKVCTVATK